MTEATCIIIGALAGGIAGSIASYIVCRMELKRAGIPVKPLLCMLNLHAWMLLDKVAFPLHDTYRCTRCGEKKQVHV